MPWVPDRRSSPKLRPVWLVVSRLTWGFAVPAGWCSGYFKVSGIGTPIRSKAWRWALVGSASIGTVARAPVNRTWLRVKGWRWSLPGQVAQERETAILTQAVQRYAKIV